VPKPVWRKISCSFWERFENTCFRNIARFIWDDGDSLKKC